MRLTLLTAALLAAPLAACGAQGAPGSAAPESAPPAPLAALAERFWAWRADAQPITGDDIPRIDRSPDWLPDWSGPAVAARRDSARVFEGEWRRIDTAGWSRHAQVDYRLMGSALARVGWELDINRGWQRNPVFYLEQTIGSLHDLLRAPPPFDSVRTRAIVRRVERIPQTLTEGRANLTQAVRPFAQLAIDALADVRPSLETVERELAPQLTGPDAARWHAAVAAAIPALEAYRAWLQQRAPTMSEQTAVGREAYIGFLRLVAVVPYTPEQLIAMGRRDWERAASFETYERERNRGLPELPLYPDAAAQMAAEAADEARARQFVSVHGILTVPAWLEHYRVMPMPSYLAPLADWGVDDDLTSPTRLDQDGVSYRPPPSPALGYFYLASAKDPRPLLVHEGIPGHYMQLALSGKNDDPLRRHYYDSNSNEGIGFYAEEMMLQAGFFDDRPRVREIIYNFMRLRALRVEVDVKLALGQFTIADGARYLETMVPMDHATALSEAASFAATPGQGITYDVGKTQILGFLADARAKQGSAFSLRAFHDYLWTNGNVPIALQRWEMLGLDDEVAALGR
ncbi:MAG TPA: DUF885 family protein [Gemmatimonadales bacterium]|nr:DUF885 family protein [Gemmatimonadales bacterium]